MRVQKMLIVLNVLLFRNTVTEFLAAKCCPLGEQLARLNNTCVPIKSTDPTDASLSFVPLRKTSSATITNETEITDINEIYNDSENITNESVTKSTDVSWLPEILQDQVASENDIVFGRQKNCTDSYTVRLESPRDTDRMQWFANGSFLLRSYTVHGSYEELLVEPHEFCTDTFVDEDNATRQAQLLCICGRVRCVRKCCPLGQSYVKEHFVASGRHRYRCGANDGPWEPFDHRVRGAGVAFEAVTGKLRCGRGHKGHIELMWPGIPEHIIQSTWVETVGLDAVCEDAVVVRDVPPDAGADAVEVARLKGVVRCFPENPFVELVPHIKWLHLAKVVLWALVILATALEPRKKLSPNAQVHGFAMTWHALCLLLRSVMYMAKNLWDRYCIYSSLMFYFLATGASFWLSVLSINMACGVWKSLGRAPVLNARPSWNKSLLWYSLYAWGCTGAMTAFTGYMWYAKDVPPGLLRPTMHDIGTCFMETDPAQKLATFAYFYGPVALLLGANVALYVAVSVRFRQMARDTGALRRPREEARVKQAAARQDSGAMMYIKILLVLGVLEVAVEIVTWVLNYNHGYFWFTVLWIDILRAISIFVSTCCNKRTARTVRDRFLGSRLVAAYRQWRAQREKKETAAQGVVGQYSISKE